MTPVSHGCGCPVHRARRLVAFCLVGAATCSLLPSRPRPSLLRAEGGGRQTRRDRPCRQGAASDTQPTLLGQYADWARIPRLPRGTRSASRSPAKELEDRASRPQPRSILHVVSSRPAESVKNEVLGCRRLSLQDEPRTRPRRSAMPSSRCIPRTTAPDQEHQRRSAHGRHHAQRGRFDREGHFGRGTQSTDQYSLKGLAQALDKIEQECR
jgi:hypothetical protein